MRLHGRNNKVNNSKQSGQSRLIQLIRTIKTNKKLRRSRRMRLNKNLNLVSAIKEKLNNLNLKKQRLL